MLFPQMRKKMNTMNKIIGIFLAASLFAGCVIPKTKAVKKIEQRQVNSEKSDKIAFLPGDKQINAVKVELEKQPVEIIIQGNQKLVYTSIKQSFPFGVAIYFPETKIVEDFKMVVPENDSIDDLIVSYVDEEMATAKVEILLKQDLYYEVNEYDNILKVTLFDNKMENQTSDNKVVEPSGVLEDKHSQEKPVYEKTIVIPDRTATMTHIEFNTVQDGKSDIVIQTDHPVKYDITEDYDNNILILNLYNTKIPEYHKRPLLTQYFQSAVEELMPVQVPGVETNSKIKIKIRDQVPYRIVQNQNMLSLFFEASDVAPPVFNKVNKKLSKEHQSKIIETNGHNEGLTEEPVLVVDKKQSRQEVNFGSEKKYTGEKIKLDFYDTDIKNVFRILRSVGKLNFAIDRNVQGKVTLTLENPVPWDQVLDLVLKMNNLGIKKEGNVIRIATIETLNKEEKLMQETIVARQKSLEQKKSLEPLVTEYIPVNYSDVSTDIKPHIDQILTKNRGKISVDKRTNMVIITDTQAKIDQAREIIFRLDKVTPQIMIEAKVVEVTKDFSRELGLGLVFEKSQTEYTGKSNDFTVALNSPIASPANAGAFNFYRILGSNFLSMSAQIAASEIKGDIKVVSSPRILTLDNKIATIKQGLEYAYLERDDTGGSSVKFKNIDLLLEVTPHVTPDKRIGIIVSLTKNDIDSVTNGIPSLSTNEAKTELLINNNDTIVIGGIVKTTDNRSSSGTPFLSGIPFLGKLFRTDIDKDKRNELLIFITPSIVQLEQKRTTQ